METIVNKLRQGVGKIDEQQVEQWLEIGGLVGVFAFMLVAMMPLY